jgi:hypothetical protein
MQRNSVGNMHTSELADFVRQQRVSGQTDNAIKATLLGIGWSEGVVNESLLLAALTDRTESLARSDARIRELYYAGLISWVCVSLLSGLIRSDFGSPLGFLVMFSMKFFSGLAIISFTFLIFKYGFLNSYAKQNSLLGSPGRFMVAIFVALLLPVLLYFALNMTH